MGLREATFGREEGHCMRGKRPEPFDHGGKSVTPPTEVNSFAYQGAICHVANLKSSRDQPKILP